jgi:hypothetical protein
MRWSDETAWSVWKDTSKIKTPLTGSFYLDIVSLISDKGFICKPKEA